MRRTAWILILITIASFSGSIVTTHSACAECPQKKEKKQSTSKQEEEALGTMMLLPVSFNLQVNN